MSGSGTNPPIRKADNKSTRRIHSLCDLGATAVTAGGGHGVAHATIQQWVSAMLSEGRLFALKPSDWSVLLGGVTLCGLLTLLF